VRLILRPIGLALLIVATLVGGISLAGGKGKSHRTTSFTASHAPSSARRSAPTPRHVTRRSANAAETPQLPGGLSLEQLAGQRIVYAYAGLTPPLSLIARIRAGEAAGVIFFGPNIASRAQLRAVIRELQAASAASQVHRPLLIMADQEGGLVRRLMGAPEFSEQQIGESPNALALAGEAGRLAGENLASVGINVNLAPVLDVYRKPGDFIDAFQRSYGTNPHVVAALGSAFVAAQQRVGVAATVKHFPGLGAAESRQDTDAAPVTLDVSGSELRSTDELPYRAAIAAGAKLVMLSWATYPALDSLLPAGLSPAVIQRTLRSQLRFRGVTITDAIGAEALRGFGSDAQRGLRAAGAGADLLLCALPNVDENSPAVGGSVLDALARALASGTLGRGESEYAAERVLALRSKLGAHQSMGQHE
jgi:beta-N-acetylhexosaminidase